MLVVQETLGNSGRAASAGLKPPRGDGVLSLVIKYRVIRKFCFLILLPPAIGPLCQVQ